MCSHHVSANYPGAIPASLVAERLAEAADASEDEFWPDNISLLDKKVVNWSIILCHRQLTDIYFLTLAKQNQGRFVTLDSRITVNFPS